MSGLNLNCWSIYSDEMYYLTDSTWTFSYGDYSTRLIKFVSVKFWLKKTMLWFLEGTGQLETIGDGYQHLNNKQFNRALMDYLYTTGQVRTIHFSTFTILFKK